MKQDRISTRQLGALLWAGLMAPAAERKGLAFVDTMAADVPAALHGDRTRVLQILLNQ